MKLTSAERWLYNIGKSADLRGEIQRSWAARKHDKYLNVTVNIIGPIAIQWQSMPKELPVNPIIKHVV